jgi:hypothetical protein
LRKVVIGGTFLRVGDEVDQDAEFEFASEIEGRVPRLAVFGAVGALIFIASPTRLIRRRVRDNLLR